MRVAVVDDSVLFRRGLVLLLGTVGVEVVLEAGNGDELLAAIRHTSVDAVICDIRMPPTFTDEGLRLAEALRASTPRFPVLVLSTYAESAYATRLLADDPHSIGYLLKDRVDDASALGDALLRLTKGETVIDPEVVARLVDSPRRGRLDNLSDRERDVLGLLAEGHSNAHIAQRLFLSEKSVERHVAGTFLKLDLQPDGDRNRRVLAVLTYLQSK